MLVMILRTLTLAVAPGYICSIHSLLCPVTRRFPAVLDCCYWLLLCVVYCVCLLHIAPTPAQPTAASVTEAPATAVTTAEPTLATTSASPTSAVTTVAPSVAILQTTGKRVFAVYAV
jgi:hypothetical protein